MLIDGFIRMHLLKWLTTRAPIDASQIDTAFNVIVDWLAENDDDVTEPAYDQGWSRVFALACGDKFSTRK